MTFEQLTCPTCSETANGTCDLIPGVALFSPTNKKKKKHTVVEYDGETEIDWDSQETITEKATGKKQLACPNGHTWFTKQLSK